MCGWCEHIQLPLPTTMDRYVLWKTFLYGLGTLYGHEMQDFWPSPMYNSSCVWLNAAHICALFCSLGGRCQWSSWKIVCIKATTVQGSLPLHQAVSQPYVHVGLAGRYRDAA